MAKRSTSSDKVILDPRFSIPDGAEDQFVHDDMESLNLEDQENVESADLSFLTEYDDGYDDLDANALDVPDGFTIVSQVIRRAPGGQQVVDIVVDIPDVSGAVNYDVQVVKM
jgi:hypothetical protein